MDIIDIVLSKKYTDESLKGITGTLAGKNCTIKSATKTDGVTTVVFAWTADDGTEETTTIQVNDGVDGKDTSQEAVLFIEQTLDDAQKAQARENIGAADAARQNVLVGSEIGNPIVVDDAFSAPLYGLTLYGKSSQKNTTGAQLISLNDSYGVTTINGVTKTPIGISAWELEGISKDNAIFYPYSSQTFLSLSKGDYVFSVFGTSKAKARYTIVGGGSSGYIQTGQSQKISIQEDVKLTFNFLVENGVSSNGILMIMLNSGSTSLPWEPYTGGKPSPSPEYPQEIESVGQSGEIEVEVLGKNLIPFPYPILGGAGTQIEREGVKYTVQSDGGIRCVGTPTAVEYINLSRIKFSDVGLTATHPTDGKIVLSGEKMNYDPNNHALFIYITSDQLGKPIDTVIYPQIEFGTVDTEYEPYKPAQTLIIPTPNGLPGVPTIDNGNYTDASGQQWLCDEVDLKRGVYVQNVAFAEFGKEITVLKKNNAVSNENFVAAYFFTSPSKRIKTRQTILSNCLSHVESVNKVNKPYSISNEFDTEAMYVTIPMELYENDVQMLNLLAEKKIKILYATYPTERPLSTEELEKYRSLRTYSPTTTVINDAGAGMSVGYAKMK